MKDLNTIKGFKEEFEELHQQSEEIRAKFYAALAEMDLENKEQYLLNHLENEKIFERHARELQKNIL